MKLLSPIIFLATILTATAADYPIAFLSHHKTTGSFKTQSVSEQNGPYVFHVGTDLAIANPDGTERILVKGQDDTLGLLAVHDFCIDLDGKSIIYSHIRKYPNKIGVWCDLFRVDIATGEKTQLTNSLTEWNPPWGAAQFATEVPSAPNNDRVTKGLHFQSVWNIAPCVCGDGSIVFCSNREAMSPPVDHNGPGFQLFRMDADGKHVHLIGHMNLAGALHPVITREGKIVFSSSEQQGGRASNGTGWGLWSINPDGSDWGPEISAIGAEDSFHFQTESSDGSLVATQYYDTRIYGALRVAPKFIPDPFGPPTKFGHPFYKHDGALKDGMQQAYFAYMRRGFYTPLPMMWVQDKQNTNAAGELPGMVSHPAAIPNNGILLTWTGDKGDADMNLGIYSMPDIKKPMVHHSELVKIVDNPDRHEWMARPVVSFQAIYGIEKPPVPKGLVADTLPPASPFGIVTTSSMAWPEIVTPQFGPSTGNPKFDNFTLDEAQYIRVLAFNKTTTSDTYMFSGSAKVISNDSNSEGFHSAFNERCGSYGEVALHKYRKPDGGVHYGPNPPAGSTVILDPEGKPDTSFKLELPANQPWTFQVLNSKKEAVGTAQTWHQVIPGEYRTCGGCHTHWGKVPFQFEDSFAATPEYLTQRLDKIKLAVWGRDVKPIVDKYQLPLTQFAWTQGVPFYNSDDTDVDDDPRLTQAEAEMIRLWIDTGMMSEGKFRDYKTKNPEIEREVTEADRLGPFADTQPPTVAYKVYADKILLGLYDPQAGINPASLSVTCTVPLAGKEAGEELASLFTRDGDVWSLSAVPDGDLTVTVRDNQIGKNLYGEAVGEGNRASITFALLSEGEPPLPDSDTEEIGRLKAEIEQLKTQIETLNATIQSWKTWYGQAPK